MGWVSQVTMSGASTVVSTGIFVGGGYVLDKIMPPKYATGIALLIGAISSFVLQKWTFVGTKTVTGWTLCKYLLAGALVTGAQWGAHAYLLDHEDEYKPKLTNKLRSQYSTVTRAVVAAFVFAFLSFPLKKFWVFA